MAFDCPTARRRSYFSEGMTGGEGRGIEHVEAERVGRNLRGQLRSRSWSSRMARAFMAGARWETTRPARGSCGPGRVNSSASRLAVVLRPALGPDARGLRHTSRPDAKGVAGARPVDRAASVDASTAVRRHEIHHPLDPLRTQHARHNLHLLQGSRSSAPGRRTSVYIDGRPAASAPSGMASDEMSPHARIGGAGGQRMKAHDPADRWCPKTSRRFGAGEQVRVFSLGPDPDQIPDSRPGTAKQGRRFRSGTRVPSRVSLGTRARRTVNMISRELRRRAAGDWKRRRCCNCDRGRAGR